MPLMRPNNLRQSDTPEPAAPAERVPSTPCSTTYLDFSVCGQTWESSLPLPKHHSQSAQDLVKNAYSILERGVQMKRLFLGSVVLVALGLGTQASLAAELRRAPP